MVGAPRAFLAAALCCAAALPAGAERIALDARRSHAEFRVRVMWLMNVRGTFEGVHGTVEVDRFRNRAVVDARIDATSVRMAAQGYEDWVRSREFFDATAHPQIRFESAPFPLARLRAGGELPGTLTLRGISQPIAFTLAPAGCDRPGEACPIVAHGVLRRSRFGMRSRLGTLSDKVELGFSIYATASAPVVP